MERKAELVETAHELFFKNGYDATAVSDIVKTAGVAQGTFYWYFKSKEEILDAVAERFAGMIFQGIQKVAEDKEMPADQKVWAIFGAAESSVERGGKIAEEIHTPRFSRYHDKIARYFLKRLIPVLTQVIYEGVEQGIFDTPSPEMAAIFILAPGLVGLTADTISCTAGDKSANLTQSLQVTDIFGLQLLHKIQSFGHRPQNFHPLD